MARERWRYVFRQGMANLHRPRNQTRAVVTALGFGVGLLAALYLIQSNLLRQVSLTTARTTGQPNLVFIDIQSDQAAGVEKAITDAGHPVVQAIPLIPMRITGVNGRTNAQLMEDTATARRPSQGLLRREYRSTWRDTIVSSEKLIGGAMWHGRGEGVPDSTGALVYPMSLTGDVATDLRVHIGDRITWDVQGLVLQTKLVALREVDWARFEPNFFAVFSTAALEHAPATWVVLTHVDDGGERAVLQRTVAEHFSNVIAFDIALLQKTVERIFRKVAIAVRFMAGFSLITGALVLLGAVAAGRLQRIREGALLKTLGATRRQLTRILLTEYLALGALSALVGVGLASLGAWAFVKFVLTLEFVLPIVPLGVVFVLTAVLVAVVGLTASREVFRRTAMEVLREVQGPTLCRPENEEGPSRAPLFGLPGNSRSGTHHVYAAGPGRHAELGGRAVPAAHEDRVAQGQRLSRPRGTGGEPDPVKKPPPFQSAPPLMSAPAPLFSRGPCGYGAAGLLPPPDALMSPATWTKFAAVRPPSGTMAPPLWNFTWPW